MLVISLSQINPDLAGGLLLIGQFVRHPPRTTITERKMIRLRYAVGHGCGHCFGGDNGCQLLPTCAGTAWSALGQRPSI
ncbi:hypothetical protein EVAR_16617_1 [Eumeta japonica]|uniref:Uncharacterized protein n=1 Tax=Eumeta variegata TaxID=151549 RepID=A0A4C1UZB5_EUMVA|nr:hypothetical protein EVAR_16617_1 [Eumeta japonica]